MNIVNRVINRLVRITRKKPLEKGDIEGRKKIFNSGYRSFLKKGVTSQEAYMSMIDLFCLTNGAFNEEIHRKIISFGRSAERIETEDDLFGKLSASDHDAISVTLNRDGYYLFNERVSADICSKLTDYALQHTANAVGHTEKIIYDPDRPVSVSYKFDIVELVNNGEVQQLIMNPGLIAVARNYLGCEPIFDFPAMWWSTCFKKEASSDAAQLYHFDMDRIKWLKVLVYLNDVTPDNGPHCYIRGSHQPGNKPVELLKRGYARVPDEDLLKHYKKEDLVELCGKAGSIFAGDTKCWHKGKNLKNGHRLVLEFEYTSSLFGSNYPRLVVQNPSKEFREFCRKNIRYTSNIHLAN